MSSMGAGAGASLVGQVKPSIYNGTKTASHVAAWRLVDAGLSKTTAEGS